MNKQIIQEISDVFYDRLTDDIFERYDDIDWDKDYPDLKEGNDKAKELISKDIDDFADIMKSLGKEIQVEKWKKRAFAYIDA
jgi:hypothetical protein